MADKLRVLLGLLEERLEQHDNNREDVQEELHEICSKTREDADTLEDRIGGKISEDFEKKEEEILGLIEKFNREDGDVDALIEQAKEILSKEWRYKIQHSEWIKRFVDSYKLEISSVKVEKELDFENNESIVNALQEHLNRLQESRDTARDELTEICNQRRKDGEELEKRVNGRLEELFKAEDARIQSVVKVVNERIGSEDLEEVKELTRKAQTTLLKNQKYSLIEEDSLCSYDLKVEKEASLEFIGFEERKPSNLIPSFTEKGDLSLSFTFFSEGEKDVLKDADSPFRVEVNIWEKGRQESTSKTFTKALTPGSDEPICFRSIFTANTTYCLRMRMTSQGMSTQWSDEAEFTTPEFKEGCAWKECPDVVHNKMKYSVDEGNPRIATNIGEIYCTIIGSTALPPNKVTSWNIKILKINDKGYEIFIGVVPPDINQNNEYNFGKCGWYFNCAESTLCSGPPHNYDNTKEYGLRKGRGEYVHNGDSVGVVMDTTKGELSFVVSGMNLGVAYEGIPLDKPLVPCVLCFNGDSVELDTSEVKETVVDSSIPVPSNVTAKSGTTWDSITLTWDAIEGTSLYQIEVDGSKFWDASTANTFTKKGFLPDSEHTFRVRAVRGNSVGGWSDVVKGRTQKESFKTSGWKECPDNVDWSRKYSVDVKNPRVATKIGDSGYYCTIIGNIVLPLNTVTSWSIKVLKSKYDGFGIFIGVAPSDIDQKEDNSSKCGWYFYCWESRLWSGPPHNCKYKKYGLRKEKGGQYVHTGDSVGVVMDITKGELSFVLNGVDLGVAYRGIPLDKPLVPCVILKSGGDSVELVI